MIRWVGRGERIAKHIKLSRRLELALRAQGYCLPGDCREVARSHPEFPDQSSITTRTDDATSWHVASAGAGRVQLGNTGLIFPNSSGHGLTGPTWQDIILQHCYRETKMTPTIRIDDQVWNWLQSEAEPLVDTPNTVLRRIAGFDKENTPDTKAPRKELAMTAKAFSIRHANHLQQTHGNEPRRPRYHRDGKFFERPWEFPTFLSDPEGYVWLDTEQELLDDRRLRVSPGNENKLNVVGGRLSDHPQFRQWPDQ